METLSVGLFLLLLYTKGDERCEGFTLIVARVFIFLYLLFFTNTDLFFYHFFIDLKNVCFFCTRLLCF